MYLALIIIISLIAITLLYSIFSAIVWVPMRSDDIERVIKLAAIKPGDKVYDLGCGDGRLLFKSAQQGAQAIGYEISLIPYTIAKINQLFKRKKVKIKFGDFWMINLGKADVVFFFLIPRIYPKIKKKFEKELKPGAKVIAYVWPIEGWEPVAVDKAPNRPTMYLYIR